MVRTDSRPVCSAMILPSKRPHLTLRANVCVWGVCMTSGIVEEGKTSEMREALNRRVGQNTNDCSNTAGIRAAISRLLHGRNKIFYRGDGRWMHMNSRWAFAWRGPGTEWNTAASQRLHLNWRFSQNILNCPLHTNINGQDMFSLVVLVFILYLHSCFYFLRGQQKTVASFQVCLLSWWHFD